MAYLFSDGFDGHGALADRWDTVDTGASIVTDGGKYGVGTNSMKFIGATDFNRVLLSSVSPTNTIGGTLNPLHLSFFIKVPSAPGNDRGILVFKSSSDGDGSIIHMEADGSLRLSLHTSSIVEGSSTNRIAGSSSVISNNIFHHVEMKYIADNVSGVAKLWVDGVLEIDFSGDTLSNGTITLSGYDTFSISSGWGVNVEYDDLLVWDEEGTSMNTSGQLGVHRIETLIPNGAGNSTQLTVTGAASNYLAVDEVGADDDTTYVQSSTATNKDLYTYTNMAGVPVTINGVVVHTRGTNPDNGAISFKAKIRSNITEADGTTYQLPASSVYAQHADFIGLDPDGSVAWTKAKVDAAEFGVEVV